MAEYIEQFWRSATDKDVARVMAGEVVEARFQDENKYSWFYSNLSGWSHYTYHWQDEASCFWRYCQVYAPDQWFLDKPEPGEGYRLLGKFPDEPVQGGDFAYNGSGWIELRDGCNPTQYERIWYRRRIEPPKSEPQHYTLAIGDTVETLNGFRLTVTEHGVEVT